MIELHGDLGRIILSLIISFQSLFVLLQIINLENSILLVFSDISDGEEIIYNYRELQMVIYRHCKLIVSTGFLVLLCSLGVIDYHTKNVGTTYGADSDKDPMITINADTEPTKRPMTTTLRKENAIMNDDTPSKGPMKMKNANDTTKAKSRTSTPGPVAATYYGSKYI